MNLKPIMLACALTAAFTSLCHAQIVWGAMQAITGDSDINTNGIYLDAINTTTDGGFNSTVVGTTTFHAFTSVTNVSGNEYIATDGIITDDLTIADGNFHNHAYSGGSAAYEYVQNNGTDVSTATVTIGSLIAGHQYQIQAWAYWPGPYNANIDGTYAPGDGTNPVSFTQYSGSYDVGTFTATGTTFSFGYEQNHPSNGGFLDDIAVRDLGVVPEPSTWAMMFVGLGALLLVPRFRRKLSL